MTFECELKCEKTCKILNEKLGDCEMLDESSWDEERQCYTSGWRCPHYKEKLEGKTK